MYFTITNQSPKNVLYFQQINCNLYFNILLVGYHHMTYQYTIIIIYRHIFYNIPILNVASSFLVDIISLQ